MATTFNKALKAIEVKTIGGNTISAQDTAADMRASSALSEFEMGKTMHIRGANAGETTLIPFHAVDNILVTMASESVTKPDAYCPEP